MSNSAGRVPLTFKVYRAGALIKEQTLTQSVIKVGKLSSAHLCLDDESVSRMHAYIQVSGPTEVYLSDLGSAKGTIVNGLKVNKARLQSGDRVRLGDTEVVVEIGVATVAEPVAVPSVRPAMTAIPGPIGSPCARPPSGAGATAQGGGGLPERTSSFQSEALSADDLAQVECQDGSRSVEVIATYRGTPRIWKHLPNARAGRPGLATLVVFILGLGLTTAGFGLMIHENLSVVRQTAHQARVKEFIKERGLSDKFVPKVKSDDLMDNLSYSLAFFGMIWLILGSVRLKDDLQRPDFTIGEHPGNSFHTPMSALPEQAPAFPLVRSDGSRFNVTFTSRMNGWIDGGHGQGQVTLEELVGRGQARPSAAVEGAYELAIADGMRGELQTDADTVFTISSVPSGRPLPPAALPARAAAVLTEPMFMTTAGTTLVTALVFALYLVTPRDAQALESDSMESKGRMQRVMREEVKAQRQEEEKKKEPEKETKPQKPDPKAPEVTSQTTSSSPRDERMANQGAGPANPGADATKPSAARGAGILGVLSHMSQNLGSMFSRDSAVGSEAEDALGALVGHTVGDEAGIGGLLGGGGRAGGGQGTGGVGFGGWGQFGKGGNGGSRGGFDLGGSVGGPRIGRYTTGGVQILGSSVRIEGGIDAAIIQRVIRRHLPEIQFCYVSVGLPSNPRLEGIVKVTFTITALGTVGTAQVSSTTLGHPQTEACIAGAVRRWRFPKPEGSMPFVTYPFRFAPVGGQS